MCPSRLLEKSNHTGTGVRIDFYQPVPFQHGNRLPNRGVTHIQLFGNGHDRKPFAWLIFQLDDVFPDNVVDLLPDGVLFSRLSIVVPHLRHIYILAL